MATITAPAHAQNGPLRPLNILRDLPQVADLIELCFASTIDDEGQSYLQQMRRASHDHDFLNWAGKVMDSTALPLSGFIWEEEGKIIGNSSLVYQSYQGRRIAMIANVATHPDYRRRGIGHALTEHSMNHALQKGYKEIWLHVRDDNPGAIKIYKELGFVERARRTTYYYRNGSPLPIGEEPSSGVTVSQPQRRDWPRQSEWLKRAHPEELSWYVHWNWEALGPGLWNWLQRNFVEFDIRQWASFKNGQLLAAVSWMPMMRASSSLWIAAPPEGDPAGLAAVLRAARNTLMHYRRLTVEHPAGEMSTAIESAGFEAFRTLIWMRADATS